MKKYTLKTRLGEKIAYANAYDLFEAEDIFSKIKKLNKTVLNELFVVEVVD